jgi:hypothetical protein
MPGNRRATAQQGKQAVEIEERSTNAARALNRIKR